MLRQIYEKKRTVMPMGSFGCRGESSLLLMRPVSMCLTYSR